MSIELKIIIAGIILFIIKEIVGYLKRAGEETHREVDKMVESVPCIDVEDTCKYLAYDEKGERWFCRKCKQPIK